MRRKQNYKRDHEPDVTHKSVAVGRFINYLMNDGKKLVAEGILSTAFERIKKETQLEPLAVFEKALENAAPAVELGTRRIGGAN